MSNANQSEINKQCLACEEIKSLSEFYTYIHKNGKRYYSGRCKYCHSELCKKIRNSPHGKQVYSQWTKSESGITSIKNRMKTWRDKNKEKRKAHSAISNAIRDNRLKRQPCRICNAPNGEAHHLSYDDPYNIDWLCKACHITLHYPVSY